MLGGSLTLTKKLFPVKSEIKRKKGIQISRKVVACQCRLLFINNRTIYNNYCTNNKKSCRIVIKKQLNEVRLVSNSSPFYPSSFLPSCFMLNFNFLPTIFATIILFISKFMIKDRIWKNSRNKMRFVCYFYSMKEHVFSISIQFLLFNLLRICFQKKTFYSNYLFQ